jgi:hypothetical protein
MPYIFKLDSSDKIINLVKTYPKVSFVCYNGLRYLNNAAVLSGAFSSSIRGVPSGYVSLYEQSIDRNGTVDFGDTTVLTNPHGFQMDPLGYAVDAGESPVQFYSGLNPKYSTFKTKDGSRINFKTVSTQQFNLQQEGQPFSSTYPLSASIHKYFFSGTSKKYTTSSHVPTLIGLDPITGSVSKLAALKNTMNHYATINPNYLVSSSVRNLLASTSVGGYLADGVGLLSVPTIIYGDSIKKGSVDLQFYVTGTLVGRLRDSTRNGDLIQVGPKGSKGSGSVAGVALYNEGFFVLTGSWDLSNGEYTEPGSGYGTATARPTWVNFAQCISASAPAASGSTFVVDFTGSHKIPTLTLFVNAPKNLLNHSNNPTYRDKASQLVASTGSLGYIENAKTLINNTVSSSYNDPTGSFAKTTYISKIGIYDKNKNLIGIAKVATPVKKTEERELTFKLKLDI